MSEAHRGQPCCWHPYRVVQGAARVDLHVKTTETREAPWSAEAWYCCRERCKDVLIHRPGSEKDFEPEEKTHGLAPSQQGTLVMNQRPRPL